MPHQFYTAIVRNNQDDEKRGRIKVSCADLLGSDDVTVPTWIEPSSDWGWFIVPDVGEMIRIGIESSSDQDGVLGQIMIDAPDMQWDGARYYTEAEEKDIDAATRVHEDFTTNYGKRRGFTTPYGHIILFDDTHGDSQIYISAVVKKHSTESGTAVAAELVNQIILDSDGIHLSVLGDSSKHVAIVETLETLWGAMKSTLDTWGDPETGHTHPTAMGSSGPPTQKLIVDEWDGDINSTKVTIPDG